MPARPARKAPNPPVAVDILVEVGNWPAESKLKAISSRVIRTAVETIRPALENDAELSLVFTDDAHVRALNRRFRNKDQATNVLSFPAAPPDGGRFGPLLGDIVLAREIVFSEAEAEDLTIEAHLAHLILHGFLHILGYDHEDEAEALAMERLETAILGGLGIADPYAGSP